MTRLHRLAAVLATSTGMIATASAAEPGLAPAGFRTIGKSHVRPCPPGVPCYPSPLAPSSPTDPSRPTDPNQPTDPNRPNDPNQPLNLPPAVPPTTPSFSDNSNLLAEAPSLGTGSGGTLLPTVNGDLIGGGLIAGPLPVQVGPTGQLTQPVLVRLPNGQLVNVGGNQNTFRPTDELFRSAGRGATAPGANTVTTGLFPPPGTTFDEAYARSVAQIPQIVRGAFKVTENDSPRPMTRAYFSYYFYDQVGNPYGDPRIPRISVHQQIFGYEQAFWNRRASVGIRLPYNQLVGGRFYNDTSLGDITLTSKYALYDDPETGSLFSVGMLLTVPTGSRPFSSTITGDSIHGTLIQPYFGYIYRRGDWYAQGFNSFIFPTDSNDITLYTNDVQVGYILYNAPGRTLSRVIPTMEAHLNVPLNNRGNDYVNDTTHFPDQLTLLGGLQMLFKDKAGLGISTGAPVTGPRLYSLQATVQFNYWF